MASGELDSPTTVSGFDAEAKYDIESGAAGVSSPQKNWTVTSSFFYDVQHDTGVSDIPQAAPCAWSDANPRVRSEALSSRSQVAEQEETDVIELGTDPHTSALLAETLVIRSGAITADARQNQNINDLLALAGESRMTIIFPEQRQQDFQDVQPISACSGSPVQPHSHVSDLLRTQQHHTQIIRAGDEVQTKTQEKEHMREMVPKVIQVEGTTPSADSPTLPGCTTHSTYDSPHPALLASAAKMAELQDAQIETHGLDAEIDAELATAMTALVRAQSNVEEKLSSVKKGSEELAQRSKAQEQEYIRKLAEEKMWKQKQAEEEAAHRRAEQEKIRQLEAEAQHRMRELEVQVDKRKAELRDNLRQLEAEAQHQVRELEAQVDKRKAELLKQEAEAARRKTIEGEHIRELDKEASRIKAASEEEARRRQAEEAMLVQEKEGLEEALARIKVVSPRVGFAKGHMPPLRPGSVPHVPARTIQDLAQSSAPVPAIFYGKEEVELEDTTSSVTISTHAPPQAVLDTFSPDVDWRVESDVRTWSPDVVAQYVRGLQLDFGVHADEYADRIVKERVAGAAFAECNSADLKELGVSLFGHRKLLLLKIRLLCASPENGSDGSDAAENGSDTIGLA